MDDDASTSHESPWWSPPEDHRRAVATELGAEVAPGHPLHGLVVNVVQRCGACDEVLVGIAEDDFGLVHLTWSGHRETPPWPQFTRTGSFAATEDALNAHAWEHGF